jgi:hypothetical protein
MLFKSTSLAGAVILAAVALVGCEANQNQPPVQNDDSHLAAYAANSSIPTSQPSTDLQVGVLLPASNPGDIELVNYSDKTVPAGNLWVNGSFVVATNVIPPHGVLNVATNQAYDKNGNRLDNSNVGISSVQLATDGGFYNLWGPVKNP